MNLTPDILQDAKSALSAPAATVDSVMSSVKDPIGSALIKTLGVVNKLVVNIESKIVKLEEDIVKMADNTGKVSLVNNVLVVTVAPENAAKIPQYEAQVQTSINRLTQTMHTLKVASDSLRVLSTTARTLKAALDVQEALLTVGNPAAAATMTLIKKAIKILFYKDVLGEYVKIISTQVAQTETSIAKMTSKLTDLSIQFKVQTDAAKGEPSTVSEVKTDLTASKMASDSSLNLQYYTDDSGRDYTLTIESYKNSGIIGRARDRYSNLLIAETSPSFIYTKDQILEELKLILNS